MSSKLSSENIKAEAIGLGFFACGIARAEEVDSKTKTQFTSWLTAKGHADMEYMSNNQDLRLNPQLLMDNLKSIISVALNYTPEETLPKGELQISAYALGQDYHDVVKKKLYTLAKRLNLKTFRVFCDSAPILERYWAVKAGLGWIGKNHQLIIPNAGSMFFLGELLLDTEVSYDKPIDAKCGSCRACIDACPTGALRAKEDFSTFNSSLCLSYLTIENRGNIPSEAIEKMGDMVYGCDHCQRACPWNRFSTPTTEESLKPNKELFKMTREKWNSLTKEEYLRLFKGSAVKRAKYEGLMRNIKAIQK
ncbi:MAG: tRNA epoxyqueuosine(34) reductase QueG [Prevotella sp.]|nr:tRNA epoxyqueuosine(34) reductase QueG [Prevotella sp.]